MKKIFLFLIILVSIDALGQSFTTVTGTVQDSSGQVWSNLTVNASFVPASFGTGKPTNAGLPITDTPQVTTGNGSGTFTLVVDDNLVVKPSGSKWSFNICSNTSALCVNLTLQVFGPTMDISSQINSTITIPVVNAGPMFARAYNVTNEVAGGNGTAVIRTSDNTLWYCQTTPGLTCPPGWSQIGGFTLPPNVLKWQGNWDGAVNYNVQDVVFSNFTVWVALNANINSLPSISNPDWQPFVIYGSNQQVSFNDNGVLAGDPNFIFDKITDNLTVTGLFISKGLVSNAAGAWSVSATEGTNNCTPALTIDCLWSDSTTHRWMMNDNNAGNLRLVGITAPGTSGHLASLAANGIDLVDSSFPASQIGTMQTSINNNTTNITNLTTQVNNIATGDFVQAGVVSGCGGTCTYNFPHTYSTLHSCVCSGEGGSCNVASKTTSSCTINTTVGTNDIIVSGVY